jgi:hypothetical protein
MPKTTTGAHPPEKLISYVKAYFRDEGCRIRQRSAFCKGHRDEWILICCVVEAFPNQAPKPCTRSARRYENTVFFEHWLNVEGCQALIRNIQNGGVTIEDIAVQRSAAPFWQTQTVPLKNMFMSHSGWIVLCPFDQRSIQWPHEPLVSAIEPYFPDAAEATRDWLGLARYNGQSDSRNGAIIFLLPEDRAFFTSAASNNGSLMLHIGGSEADANGRSLLVKGAFWEDGTINHFEAPVINRVATLSVPDDVIRLEYVLLDTDGELFDFQQESWGTHTGLIRERGIKGLDQSSVRRIREVCGIGENQSIEFKPFVDPNESIGSKNNRSKFGEVVKTVVSFANTRGGGIYIGISDACAVIGITTELKAWGKQEFSQALADRYRGTLINKIRGAIVGEVAMMITVVSLDDTMVAIIDVSEAPSKPVVLQDDNHFYVRAGANNRRLPPNLWKTAIGEAS